MSDIHGCYDELMDMMKKIELSSEDTLIIAGDYMDRGDQSEETLEWILNVPENVVLLKGNHDIEFISYVERLESLKGMFEEELSDDSLEDTNSLINLADMSGLVFDYYHTIHRLYEERGITLSKLKEWSAALEKLPYTYETDVEGKHFIIVHAGYIESENLVIRPTVEDFYIYAREEAYIYGGKKDSVIVAGHTPTISSHRMTYTGGTIYKHYNKEINCTYYDVDCGAVFRKLMGEGNMACLRLDDEKEFYLFED